MKIKIRKGAAHGRVSAPPSKSMAHRMLICAGLADGTSVLQGISDSQDMQATLDCLTALGAHWQKDGETVTIRGIGSAAGATAQDHAGNAGVQAEKLVLQCRESGSTLRFFVPLCLRTGRRMQLVGAPRLMERPLGVYEQICRERGLTFVQEAQVLTVQGPLTAGNFQIPGNISSQFISGLLLALPMCEGDSILSILPPIESRPYIDMTLAALQKFGVNATWQDAQTLRIPGGQTYRACSTQVEGDFSNAAFFAALAAIRPENRIVVDDLPEPENSLQADRVFPQLLAELAELFEATDLIKYAGMSGSNAEKDKNLMVAVEYVNTTKEESGGKKTKESVAPEIKRSYKVRVMLVTANYIIVLTGCGLIAWSLYTVYNMLY